MASSLTFNPFFFIKFFTYALASKSSFEYTSLVTPLSSSSLLENFDSASMCGVIGSICNFERNSDKYLLSDSFPEFAFADAKEKEPTPKAKKRKNSKKNRRKRVVVVIFVFLVYISRACCGISSFGKRAFECDALLSVVLSQKFSSPFFLYNLSFLRKTLSFCAHIFHVCE